jgi:ribulose-phosphate 3-epimerase
MTVNPGFSGQRFIPSSVEKVHTARRLLVSASAEDRIELQVDGGIDLSTAPGVVAAGATVLVAGSALFAASGGIDVALPALRAAAALTGSPPSNRKEHS